MNQRERVVLWHVLTEGFVGAVALNGVFYLFRGAVTLWHRLEAEIENSAAASLAENGRAP